MGKWGCLAVVISMTARIIDTGGPYRHFRRTVGLDGKRLKLVSANTVPVLPPGLGNVKKHWHCLIPSDYRLTPPFNSVWVAGPHPKVVAVGNTTCFNSATYPRE